MTKDGLVEENLTDKSSVRVSNRASDVQMGRKQGEKEENLVDKSPRHYLLLLLRIPFPCL